MDPRHYLDDVTRQFRKLKSLAERAVDQVGEEDLLRPLPDKESNSIAIIMKHMAGNMRSRWTDFLHTDGEKADRERDSEFIIAEGDGKAALTERWELGWDLLMRTLASLEPADLERTVHIRKEPHTVLQALQRQLSHYSYHVGQIVLLARHHAGESWVSLSIPRGKSAEYEVAKDGIAYTLDDPPSGPGPGDGS